MKGNVIVGQSGGPTSAINSSLAGVYRTAIDRGAKKVYGMRHGIQGLLEEKYIDLSEHIRNELDEELLKRTPAAYLGSCRYKLPEIHENPEIFEKIFGILDKLEIECFIYIGGNDSMDTIKKLSDYAIVKGYTTKFIGVPKTIDNDLALTDHTPGYGSAAKYIGTSTKEIIRDSNALEYGKGLVTVIEIMGRNAGWLTGAAALSKGEDCEGPDLIYLPELAFDVEKFVEKVKGLLEKKQSVVVAVSEGIRLADGRYVCELTDGVDYVDAFGLPDRQRAGVQGKGHRAFHTSASRFPSGFQDRYHRGLPGRRCGRKGSRRRRYRRNGDPGEDFRRSVSVYHQPEECPQGFQRGKGSTQKMDQQGRRLCDRGIFKLCEAADPGRCTADHGGRYPETSVSQR